MRQIREAMLTNSEQPIACTHKPIRQKKQTKSKLEARKSGIHNRYWNPSNSKHILIISFGNTKIAADMLNPITQFWCSKLYDNKV